MAALFCTGCCTASCTAAAMADSQPMVPSPVLSAELGLGFDSNPAQSSDAVSLGFAEVGLGAQWQVRDDLSFDAEAGYRDYAGANDNWTAAVRIDWLAAAEGARSDPLTLSAEAGVYRDQLVTADARNELALAGRWQPIVTPRTELVVGAELRGQHYLNSSLPWSGRPGSASRGRTRRAQRTRLSAQRGAPGAGVDRSTGATALDALAGFEPRQRYDGLAILSLDGAWYFSALLSGLGTLSLGRRASTEPAESYDNVAVDLLFSRGGVAGWTLELGLGWYRSDYDRAPQDLHRRDEGRSLALAARRPLGRAELSCSVSWLDNRSTVAIKSFAQAVTWCGLAWQ
ncbi:MAG: hypothetical protein LJE69_10140 [Thiohalocapsa sp.]|jgi:hypothetical protein|uniref:hypothetical protein n=1 Tax=Thiohalocapsa sp. TaxID=2497641 RepID=UPI0025EBE9AC|nr:hypothetical protein [Thiohalocapsa sp.]MCG6941597.1 hypothetical protein [Thiohalocapsa sp.]